MNGNTGFKYVNQNLLRNLLKELFVCRCIPMNFEISNGALESEE